MKVCENTEKIHTLLKENEEKFAYFLALLKEYNEKYNLTAIKDEKEIYYKHFFDSVAGEFLIKENASVVEIGSGAGFPSVPLKLVRDDLSFTLIESVQKKCDFLSVVVDKLGLKNVKIKNVRAEDLGKDKLFREKYDVAVARAVARMNTLSEYALPLVKVGGCFIGYKSGDTTEINEANSAYRILGAKLKEIYTYSLPDGMGERTLAVVEKLHPTPNQYPRGQGKERKKPL